MILSPAQSYALLEKHSCYITEICDKCGRGLGPVRFIVGGELGVWCSRECRGDSEREVIHRGGRPKKYRNSEEARDAKVKLQRIRRNGHDEAKTPLQLAQTKHLQAQKSPLSHYPLAGAFGGFAQP